MTEQEFTQAQQKGQVEKVALPEVPITDLPAAVEALQAQMRDYIPLLERLRKSEIPTPAGSSAWSLVSYTTAPTGSSITIAGLDLAADLLYDIIVECRNVTNAGILTARVNNDGTPGRHLWGSNGNRYNGAPNEDNPGEDAAAAATKWDLSHSAGSMSHHASIRLGYNSGTPLASWNTASIGKIGDAADVPAIETGCGFWVHSDNITSLVLSHNSGADCEWKVWVFKAATS